MDKIKQFEPFFGEWYAESFIGAGSYGRVYKIYREEFGERFYSALKYISIPADESETAQLRIDGMDEKSISEYYTEITKDISAETRLMNKLRGNTNVVGFEDSKIQPKEGGMGYDVFIRMELLTPLTARIISKPLTPADTVKLGRDVCTALELCQKQGIIHRDIKPDNIFVNENGDYKLGDFGIARRLEKTSTFMSKKGTYNYMAPEVYKGEKYGASCDIYSLGIVMYRLLNNGRLPFLPAAPNPISPEDRENAIVRRMSGERLPAPCNADPGLAAIVLKACAYDPKDRFASAAQMRDALSKLSTASRKPAAAGAAVPGIADDADKTQRVRKTPVNDRTAKPAAIKEKPEKKRNKTGLFIGVAAAALGLLVGLLAVAGVFKKGDQKKQDAAVNTTETEAALNSDHAELTPSPTPTPTPTTTPTPKPTATPTPEFVSRGDIITFGSYEQDNNSNNGKEKIEWIILEVKGNKALIISRYAIDCMPYNNEYKSVTWETCTLRSWLNSVFYKNAFSSSEQMSICQTTITNDDNLTSETPGGRNTTDRIFLLSIEETCKNFGYSAGYSTLFLNDSCICQATAYAKAKGAYIDSRGNCGWWLRSPGDNSYRATSVNFSADLHSYDVDDIVIAVRPALWIDIGY